MNLPAIKSAETALSIKYPKPGQTPNETRRLMLQLPEVVAALTPVERGIMEASTKTLIRDMEKNLIVDKLKPMLKYIAIDVGFHIPTDKDEWAYIQTRLLVVICKYYSCLTLSEIKLAFELLTVGELDDYLPRDSQKQPDSKHYQNFNADYFGKVLNAYIKKRNEIIGKADEAVPNEQPEGKQEKRNDRFRRWKCLEVFYNYKYRGRLIDNTGLHFVFEWLVTIGYANEVVPTAEDRHRAFMLYRKRVIQGLENRYQAAFVLKQGEVSEVLDYPAECIARDKEIKRAFDKMLSDDVLLKDFI